jgi:hypothetical protein
MAARRRSNSGGLEKCHASLVPPGRSAGLIYVICVSLRIYHELYIVTMNCDQLNLDIATLDIPHIMYLPITAAIIRAELV